MVKDWPQESCSKDTATYRRKFLGFFDFAFPCSVPCEPVCLSSCLCEADVSYLFFVCFLTQTCFLPFNHRLILNLFSFCKFNLNMLLSFCSFCALNFTHSHLFILSLSCLIFFQRLAFTFKGNILSFIVVCRPIYE